MAGHTSEKRWTHNRLGDAGISDAVKGVSIETVTAMNKGEEIYQDMLELWSFAGGTDQLVADQLFFEIWSRRVSDPVGNPGVVDIQANAMEVTQVSDAKEAMLAIHELYQAMTNAVVTQADRITLLRRMT